MNEEELREMVRASIARQRGGGSGGSPEPLRHAPDAGFGPTFVNAAFARLPLVRGGDEDGMCLIEPAVRCNHCGYCQSYGH